MPVLSWLTPQLFAPLSVGSRSRLRFVFKKSSPLIAQCMGQPDRITALSFPAWRLWRIDLSAVVPSAFEIAAREAAAS